MNSWLTSYWPWMKPKRSGWGSVLKCIELTRTSFHSTFTIHFQFVRCRKLCRPVRRLFLLMLTVLKRRSTSEEDTMRIFCALCGLFLAVAIVNCSPVVKREAEETLKDLDPLNEVSHFTAVSLLCFHNVEHLGDESPRCWDAGSLLNVFLISSRVSRELSKDKVNHLESP